MKIKLNCKIPKIKTKTKECRNLKNKYAKQKSKKHIKNIIILLHKI
jgi:homoserine kinase